VAHAYNPDTQEAKIRRIEVPGQCKQKFKETHISTNKKLNMVAHACHPSYTGDTNRMNVRAGPGKKYENLLEK
jgi:ribosomal protein L31